LPAVEAHRDVEAWYKTGNVVLMMVGAPDARVPS